jgi:hypothetical protein
MRIDWDVKVEGVDHNPTFTASVTIQPNDANAGPPARAVGRSNTIRGAKQEAAHLVLSSVKQMLLGAGLQRTLSRATPMMTEHREQLETPQKREESSGQAEILKTQVSDPYMGLLDIVITPVDGPNVVSDVTPTRAYCYLEPKSSGGSSGNTSLTTNMKISRFPSSDNPYPTMLPSLGGYPNNTGYCLLRVDYHCYYNYETAGIDLWAANQLTPVNVFPLAVTDPAFTTNFGALPSYTGYGNLAAPMLDAQSVLDTPYGSGYTVCGGDYTKIAQFIDGWRSSAESPKSRWYHIEFQPGASFVQLIWVPTIAASQRVVCSLFQCGPIFRPAVDTQNVVVVGMKPITTPLWTTSVEQPVAPDGAPPEGYPIIPPYGWSPPEDVVTTGENDRADKEKAERWNKEMHTTNGNTSTVRYTTDILEMCQEVAGEHPEWFRSGTPEVDKPDVTSKNKCDFECITFSEKLLDMMGGDTTARGLAFTTACGEELTLDQLAFCDEVVPKDDGVGLQPRKAERPLNDNPGTLRAGPSAMGARPKATKVGDEVKASSGPNLVAQRRVVIDRVVRGFGEGRETRDDNFVRWILAREPERRFAYDVSRALWGDNWSADSWHRAWAQCTLAPIDLSAVTSDGLAGKTRTSEAMKLAAIVMGRKTTATAMNTVSGEVWFEKMTNINWKLISACYRQEADAHNKRMHAANGNRSSYLEMLARMWNQIMHALNGNMSFNGDMKEVRERPAVIDLYKAARVENRLKPEYLAMVVSTVPSSINPVDQDITTQAPLRGDIVDATNTTVLGSSSYTPESLGFPRQVRNGLASGLIDSVQRLSTIVVGLMSYQARPLVDTELLRDVVIAAMKANANLGRADNVTLGGFLAIDVAYIGRLKAFYGFTSQSFLVKLLMLMHLNTFATSRGSLPLSNEAGHFDAFTQLDPAPTSVTLAYNDSTVFGEGLGGATSVLPFRGGQTGTVYFHVTLETVPEDQRNLAVFLPANMLLSDPNSGLAIALFVHGWADYPSVMWTVAVPTVDTGGGNAAQQTFVPHLSTVLIPGLTTLHVILPRRTTSRNPTDYPTANLLVLQQPRTGAVATTAFPLGNVLLDVNAVGQPLVGYNMAEYLYSWYTETDTASIAQFIQRYNDLVDISDDVYYLQERIASVCVRTAPLRVNTLAGLDRVAVNSDTSSIQLTSFGTVCEQTTANWPLNTLTRPDILIAETDIVAWNKIALGMGTVEGKVSSAGPVSTWLANPLGLYWLELLHRAQAVSCNVHYSALGLSGEAWDTAYTNTVMRSVRELARAHYSGGVKQGLQPAPALMAPKMDALYTSLYGASPIADDDGNSVFAYWCPPKTSRVVVMNAAGVTYGAASPQWYPDVWIQLTCRHIPRFAGSFPPQNNDDSTCGMVHDDYTSPLVAGLYYGPMLRQSTPKFALNQDETRDDTDDEIWNARLAWVMAANIAGSAMVFRDMSGAATANAVPSTQFPKQAILTFDYSTPNPATGMAATNTMFQARNTSTGVVSIPTDTRVNMVQINKVMTGQLRAAIEIWALNNIVGAADIKLGPDGAGKSIWLDMLRHQSDPSSTESQGGVQPVPEDPSLASETTEGV